MPITIFAELDAAMLGVMRAYVTLQNEKFSRGESLAWDRLEQAAKRLRDAIRSAEDEANGHAG